MTSELYKSIYQKDFPCQLHSNNMDNDRIILLQQLCTGLNTTKSTLFKDQPG